MKTRYLFILGLVVGFFSAAGVDAVTLTWQNPATYTDGTPIAGEINSRVYCGPAGGAVERYASTLQTSIDLAPCAPDSQWLVRAEVSGRESGPSNVVYYNPGVPDSTGTPLPPVVTSEPAPMCTPCPACNTEPVETVWHVQPWRDATTRPVYSAQNFAATPADQRVEIGRVNVGTLCGEFIAPYSSTITSLEWRRVTATNMHDGAAVCEAGQQ